MYTCLGSNVTNRKTIVSAYFVKTRRKLILQFISQYQLACTTSGRVC
jgi:hypothetical protein